MNFAEFVVYCAEHRDDIPHLRDGQYYMNQLWYHNRNLYSLIANTDIDPFYDDRFMLDYWNFLMANWSDNDE